jgi:general nucleoside transport system permease protein
MTTLEASAAGGLVGTASPARRARRAPIVYGVLTVVVALLFLVLGRDQTATFALASGGDLVRLPPVILPARPTGVAAVLVALGVTVASTLLTVRRRRQPRWLPAVFTVALLVGFLAWVTAGNTLPLPGLLAGSLALSVPLIFGALGGVISERVGVVNVAIEGQLLAGAFVAAFAASVTRSVVVGLLAAMVAGMLVSFVLAAFAIKYLVDQVIVGVVLNVLVLGLTSFLYTAVLVPSAQTLNSPPQLPTLPIPVLSAIPVIGPVLFDQTVIVYLMYVGVAAVTIGLYTTRWGLRLRAVGEHPQAADTVGISVGGTRFWNVSLAGAIAGLGGAYFTLAAVPSFSRDVTSGAGFIALAAVIFGQWNPVRATLAALLFGFASNLQNVLGIFENTPVPSDFLLMLPYVVTIFAVAGFVGQVRGPAAAGKPYLKG